MCSYISRARERIRYNGPIQEARGLRDRYTPPQHNKETQRQADRLLGERVRCTQTRRRKKGKEAGARKKGSDAAEEEERSRRKTAALLPARFGLLERKVRPGKK